MKLIRRKADYLAVYLFEDTDAVTLEDTMLSSPLRALDINSSTHEVINNVAVPIGGFKPSNQYYINGVWSDA